MTNPITPEASPETTTVETGGAGEATGTNPAWDPVLSLLPERIQDSVKPHFKTWDDNYRKLETEFSEYKKNNGPREASPYDEFKGVPVEDIRAALGISQTIASDPRRVAEVMAEQLGLTLSEAKKIVSETVEKAPEFTDDDDPRLKQFYDLSQQQAAQLKQIQEQQQNFFALQQQREQEAINQAERARTDKFIDAELQQLFTDHPEVKDDQALLNQLFTTASFLSTRGSQSPLKDAYTQVSGLIESRTQRAPSATPLFVPTGGQAPPANDAANMSTRERALAMLETLHKGQG